MDDTTAFEHQVENVLQHAAGPSLPVDAASIVELATTGGWTVITRQLRGRISPTPTEGGFTMFSALKFIAAGVIVALFGGFLLVGILTTQREDGMAPAAVNGSPEPEATTAPTKPAQPPNPSVRTDILPGVALTVEEVEPGVLRVVNDSVSDFAYPVDWGYDYDIVAGDDGGIYVLEPEGHFAVLGEGGASAAGGKGYDWFATDVEVAPDGTLWGVSEDAGGRYIVSFDRGSEDGTRHLPTTDGPGPIEVTSDGTVWAVWLDDSGSAAFGYLGADGWTMVGEWPVGVGKWPFRGRLYVTDRGDVWAVGYSPDHLTQHVSRFVDGAWRTEEYTSFHPRDIFSSMAPADVGVDGTLWGIWNDRLFRFDGTGWTRLERPDWLPSGVATWELTEDGWVPNDSAAPTSMTVGRSYWGEPHVAPDGALWVPSRLGVLKRDPDLGGGYQAVCGGGLDGVATFDGVAWSRFLQGRCIEAMDIAADGSVWLLASKSDTRYPPAHVYVITPEAVAAIE